MGGIIRQDITRNTLVRAVIIISRYIATIKVLLNKIEMETHNLKEEILCEENKDE